MRAFSNPIFNPLCPPVLGEIEIWGIPPSPRQEVSCTSFLGISRSLQPPLSPSLGGIWSRGTSFEKLRTGPKPPAEREFPLCASPTSKQFQANVFHTNSHSIGTGVSITTGRSEHLLRPGPGAGAPGYPEKDCIFVLRGADCSQHDRFQRKQEQRDKRSVQTLILASERPGHSAGQGLHTLLGHKPHRRYGAGHRQAGGLSLDLQRSEVALAGITEERCLEMTVTHRDRNG